MVKIFQGELPKTINVVVNSKVIATARFIDGVYETENKEIIAELKRYGYEVENHIEKPIEMVEKPKTVTVPNKKPVKPAKKKVK